MNRRQFLCGASASVAMFHIVPASVLKGAQGLLPNDKVNVAGIGIGSQGGSDIDAVAGEGHNLVALCDVDEKYAAKKFRRRSLLITRTPRPPKWRAQTAIASRPA